MTLDEFNDIALVNDAAPVNDYVVNNDAVVAAEQDIKELADSETHTRGKLAQCVYDFTLAASLVAVTVAAAASSTPVEAEIPAPSVYVKESVSAEYIGDDGMVVAFTLIDEYDELDGIEIFLEDVYGNKVSCEVHESEDDFYMATTELTGLDRDTLIFVMSAVAKNGWTGEIYRQTLSPSDSGASP